MRGANADWRTTVPEPTGLLVRVREVVQHDARILFELLTDPRVTTHISPPPPSITAFEGFIAWAHRERRRGRSVCFGIVPHGLEQAVGIIQVRALGPEFFVAEWGFALGVAFWGTGVFPEAASLVAQFAFETLGVHRLEGRAVTANARGIGALQKLGASAEAVLAKAFKRDVQYDEQLLWTLIGDEWTAERVAAQERLAIDDAKRRIAEAVADVTAQLRATPPSRTAPALYPFFLTDAHDPRCPTCGARKPILDTPCAECGT